MENNQFEPIPVSADRIVQELLKQIISLNKRLDAITHDLQQIKTAQRASAKRERKAAQEANDS